MHLRILMITLIVAVSLFSCGAGGEAAPEKTARTSSSPDKAVAQPVKEAVVEGSFVFEADGIAKRYDHLPAGDNFYTPVSSAIKAFPAAGSGESLRIIFLSLDLKKAAFPADLPPSKDMSKPMDPMLAMASIGFGFIDESGEEWAGPGRIHVEKFGADGVVEGSFTEVSLPHTDNTLPNMVLTEGRFRARISSPW